MYLKHVQLSWLFIVWFILLSLLISCEDEPPPCPSTQINQGDLLVNETPHKAICISSAYSHGMLGENLHQYIELSEELRIYLEYPILNPDANPRSYPFTFEANMFTAELQQICEGVCEDQSDSWRTICSSGQTGRIIIDRFTLDQSLKAEDGIIEDPFGYFNSFQGSFDITFELCTLAEWNLSEEPARIQGDLDWALK